MKKKYFYLAITAICLALFCAIPTFFLTNAKSLMIVGTTLSLFLIISFIMLYMHSSSIEKQIKKYSSDIGTLTARLEKSENIRSRYRVILTQYEQGIKHNEPETDMVRQPAFQYFIDFRENVVVPYLTSLKNVNMPLSSHAKQEIIDATIELAMQAIDIADAGEWSINNRTEQKLNLDVVAQKKTKTDAYDEAIIITDNPAVTPKWIRALSSSMKDIVSDSSMIIYSGYKR